jgi:hypothetical protein
MAQTQLKEQGFVELADFVGQAQLEPPRAVGMTKTLGRWALFVFLVAMDEFLAVSLL